MSKRRFFYLLGIWALAWLLPGVVHADCSVGFDGRWKTNLGGLTLHVDGSSVSGITDHGMKLAGSIEGPIADGRWTRGPQHGTFRLVHDVAGSFQGVYYQGRSSGDLRGTCVVDPESETEDDPRAERANELKLEALQGNCLALLQLGDLYTNLEHGWIKPLEGARWYRRAELCLPAGEPDSLKASDGFVRSLFSARLRELPLEEFEIPDAEDEYVKASPTQAPRARLERSDLPYGRSVADRGVVICNKGAKLVSVGFLEVRPWMLSTKWSLQAWRDVAPGKCRSVFSGTEALVHLVFALAEGEEGFRPIELHPADVPMLRRSDVINSFCVRKQGINDRGNESTIDTYKPPCLPGFVEVPTSAAVLLQGNAQMRLDVSP